MVSASIHDAPSDRHRYRTIIVGHPDYPKAITRKRGDARRKCGGIDAAAGANRADILRLVKPVPTIGRSMKDCNICTR